MSIANGCGQEWLPRWLKWLLFNWFFEASCNKHDIGYEKGGTEVERFKCDWYFWLAMKRDIKRLRSYIKPIALIMAVVFFVLVRCFGWLRFNYIESG